MKGEWAKAAKSPNEPIDELYGRLYTPIRPIKGRAMGDTIHRQCQ